MFKNSLIILFIIFSISTKAQEVDYGKIETISAILCECLKSNISKEDAIRIEECTNVLKDGLSPIKDENLKNAYAQKSDTYLQRNCLEYSKLIYKRVPNSDIALVDKSEFDSLNKISKKKLEYLTGKYTYTDFLGERFDVYIDKTHWIENIFSTGKKINFSIKPLESSILFDGSEDEFFRDYYNKNEALSVRFKVSENDSLTIILNLGKNIYLQKVLKRLHY